MDPAPIQDQFQYKESETPNQGKMLMLPSWVTWLTKIVKAFKAVAGESVLGADFTLDQANGTYQDAGLSISLPAAGTYLIFANVEGYINFSAGSDGYITIELYNSTDSAVVANSERKVVYGKTVNIDYIANAPLHKTITVTAAKTIKLYAARNGATVWVASSIRSSVAGRTNLGYERIGD